MEAIIFSTGSALVGLFASKNQVGLFAEIGILISLISVLSSKNRLQQSLWEIVPLALSLICLYKSQSATCVASVMAVCAAYSILDGISRLTARSRGLITMAGVAIAIIVIALCIRLGLQDVGLGLFGKDATLTGRTYLWSEGLKIAMAHPVLGDGFEAFWVPGRPEAEALWFQFDVPNRTGFHFHETFIQTFVDIGITGSVLLATLYVWNIIASLVYVLRYGLDLAGCFCCGMAIVFAIRAFVEIDVYGAFSVGALLFFSIIPYLNQQYELRRGPPPYPSHKHRYFKRYETPYSMGWSSHQQERE